MSPFCQECGARLVQQPTCDWWICPECDETRTTHEMQETVNPALLHGTKCGGCDGQGYISREIQEGHPYGDTIAIETLNEIDDCEECGSKGAHMDKDSCVVCGLPVLNGWDRNGWEVHPDCHQEETPEKGAWD